MIKQFLIFFWQNKGHTLDHAKYKIAQIPTLFEYKNEFPLIWTLLVHNCQNSISLSQALCHFFFFFTKTNLHFEEGNVHISSFFAFRLIFA